MTAPTTETNKISGSQLLARVEAIGESAARAQALALNPHDLRFFRPSMRDVAKGKAMKLDLRLSPRYNDRGYIEEVDGGLFLEIVPQKSLKSGGADATFDWETPQTKVTAKLGRADIAALLLGIRSRWLRYPLPEKISGSAKAVATEKGFVIKLFHQFEGKDGKTTTAINYHVNKDSTAFLELSRSATQRGDIVLSLTEELELECYLESALRAFQAVGK